MQFDPYQRCSFNYRRRKGKPNDHVNLGGALILAAMMFVVLWGMLS